MITVKTESGSVYEFDGDMVRRVNPDGEKRGDGRWIKMVKPIAPTQEDVGSGMLLVLDSLSDEGADDYGFDLVSDVTIRATSRIGEVS